GRPGRGDALDPRRLPADNRRGGACGEEHALRRQGTQSAGKHMMPFPGGIEGTENGILLLSIAAALLYLPVLGRPPSLRRTAVKAGSVALLAALAFEAGGPLLLVAALALSALGDAALAQEKDRFFLAGLVSFLLAHIAYVVLFLRASGGAGAPIA